MNGASVIPLLIGAVIAAGPAQGQTDCVVPTPPACLAVSGPFIDDFDESLCVSQVMIYVELLQILAECDPEIGPDAMDRANDALRELRCRERGLTCY